MKHLAFIGCSVYTDEEREKQRAWNDNSFKHTEGSKGEHLQVTWNNWAQFRWEGVTDEMIDRYISDCLRDRSRATWALQGVFAHDLRTRLPLVTQPTIVFNVQDDIYEATKRAVPLLKRGKAVDMSPARLWLTEVKTKEVADMIRDFFARD